MKVFFLSVSCILIAIFSMQSESRTITGIISDNEGLPLIGANIIIKGTKKGTTTDVDGKFSIKVDSSTKTLVVSLIGYTPHELIITKEDFYNITLEKSSEVLSDVVVTGYSERLIDFDKGASKADAKPKREAKKVRDRGKSSAESKPAMEMGELEMLASDSYGTTLLKSSLTSEAAVKDGPAAGQITAGEWNDLNNWEDWRELLKVENYKHMQEYWNIYPSERYSVFVTNEDNLPLVNADVMLWGKSGNMLWKTKSDVSGRAELWNGFAGSSSNVDKITVKKDKNTFTLKKPQLANEGSNHLRIPLPCQELNAVDIMFVVDATGSMGDEINFLRSELSDVIERVKENDENISYRTGSVFYKDKTDDYVTAQTDLDEDFSKTIGFINAKGAGGGGDYPEAVDAALDKALAQDWNPQALSRIIFLLLDAPPHEDNQTKKLISDQIKQASAMGIKIIPITASGINRETEFLMKFMSIATNGTYVFITDDSGIGNPHLDPIVDDYEVEKLNDLLVRVISNYSYQESCEPRKNLTSTGLDIAVFPNPASQFVNIKIDQKVDKIVLTSASGKVILSENNPKEGKNKIRLDNLVGGMYVISVFKEDQILSSQSLMII